MRRVMWLFGLVFLPVLVYGQNVIKGTVITEGKHGIKDVTVRLLQKDSSFIAGTVTDINGSFQLQTAETQNLFLHFSSVGYKSQHIKLTGNIGGTLDVGYVVLDSTTVTLDTVTITAQRHVRKADKTLIFPDKKQVKYAVNGYDLLANLMIPGLNVDRINKKVSTLTGEATLYINGKRASLHEVQALRPKDIAHVEYHDFPQGQYAKDIVAINYITKSYSYGGYIMASAEQRVGFPWGSYMVAAKYNEKNSTYNLIAGVDWEHEKSSLEQTEKIDFGESLLDRILIQSSNQSQNTQYAMFNYDTWGKNDNWNVTIGYTRSGLPKSISEGLTSYRQWEMESTTRNFTEQTSHQPYAGFRYYHPIDKRQWFMAEVGLTYTHTTYDRHYSENGSWMENTYKYHIRTDEDVYRLAGNLYYNISFNKNNYFMVDLAHFQYLTSDVYSGDLQSDINLISGETQLRLIYGQRIGKKLSMTFVLGGSLNAYSLRHTMSQVTFSPRPSLALQYMMAPKHSIRFSGYMGNSTPQLSLLNNLEQTVDAITVKKGNPDLDISKFIGGDFAYMFLSNNFSLSAALKFNAVLDPIKRHYFIGHQKLVESYITDGQYRNIEPLISSSIGFFDNSLKLKADFGFLHTSLRGKEIMSQNTWKGSVSATCSFDNLYFQAYCSSPEKAVSSAGIYYKIPIDYGVSTSYFIKGWAMEIGAKRPFLHKKNEWWLPAGQPYTYHKYFVDNSVKSMVYFKLSYNLDFGRKIQKTNSNVSKRINSAIFK